MESEDMIQLILQKNESQIKQIGCYPIQKLYTIPIQKMSVVSSFLLNMEINF